MTLLTAELGVKTTATLDHEQPMPNIVSDVNVDAFNARLELDATPEVRKLTSGCFQLVQRFNAAHAMRVPVDLDEHGFYWYRYDQVRGQPEETQHLAIRISLGGIHDDLVAAVDRLSAKGAQGSARRLGTNAPSGALRADTRPQGAESVSRPARPNALSPVPLPNGAQRQ